MLSLPLFPTRKKMRTKKTLKILKETPKEKIDKYNFPYTLNPYYGCSLECIYCYSTQTDCLNESPNKDYSYPNFPRSKNNAVEKLKSDL